MCVYYGPHHKARRQYTALLRMNSQPENKPSAKFTSGEAGAGRKSPDQTADLTRGIGRPVAAHKGTQYGAPQCIILARTLLASLSI